MDTVSVGDLIDVLGTRWSATVNERTHAFWSHRQLLDRIVLTFGGVGIAVESASEAKSSDLCPECGSEDVNRDGDAFRCHSCELDAHSDVVGVWNVSQSVVGPMALDGERDGSCWEWNERDWIPASFGEQPRPVDQTSFSEPVSSRPG